LKSKPQNSFCSVWDSHISDSSYCDGLGYVTI